MEARTLRLPPALNLEWCTGAFSTKLWPEAPCTFDVKAEAAPEYAGPLAQALVAAWGAWCRSHEATVRIDDSVKSRYAWRSGLLSGLAGRLDRWEAVGPDWLRAHVMSEAQIKAVVGRVIGVFRARSTDAGDAVSYFLSELLRNVFEHSGSLHGALVTAGRFTSGRATLAVVDLGMTVPAHVRRRWPLSDGNREVDDEAALRVALEPLVSGSHDRDRNAGLGLYMTRRISTLMGGRFWLTSGSLRAVAEPSGEAGARAAPEIVHTATRWPGTAVAVTFNAEQGRFSIELSAAQQELAGGTLGPRLDVFCKKAPRGAAVIRVPPDAGSLAQDKVAAARIRDEEIAPLVAESEAVIALDLRGVTLTTQSFVHALLAAPLRRLGPGAVAKRLRFVAADTQVKQVIRIVLGYVLDELEAGSGLASR